VKLVTNLSAADLQHLAAHDSDPFNRWQALQTFALRILIANVAALRAGKNTNSDNGLLDALAAILADKTLEPAFVAQALTPPSEADIAREIGHDVDPDAIFTARSHLRRKIGERLGGELLAVYDRFSVREPYNPDSASAGRRALRNVCLDLLAASGQADGIARAFAQYQTADNMTDRLAGLATLSLHDRPQRAAALEDFYKRYETDPLIVDKWLTLQSAIPDPATLDRVVALTAHPAFALTNPNRVRALIGTFAQGNPTQFNRADGAGYRFVADYVLKLNATNPQVAARLMTAFKSWRALESGRRTHAEAAIRHVAAAANLSPDVKDIADRALSGG
jgi:aminopeptidase N